MSDKEEISIVENEGDEILLKLGKSGINITKKIGGDIDEMYIGKSSDFVMRYISKSLLSDSFRKSQNQITP